MERLFTFMATKVARASGQPVTFVVAVIFIVLWATTGPLFDYSDTWQLIVNTSTTIITFLMVFIIQNSQNRDGSALQAKLDELLRAMPEARSAFVGIEHMSDAELERLRNALEHECNSRSDDVTAPEETVERLLER